jgi:SAM-dependent methyltransferase
MLGYAELRSIKRRYFTEASVARLRKYVFPFVRGLETLVYGGRVRHALLSSSIRAHYRSLFRRSVVWFSDEPHFFNNRANVVNLAFDENAEPYSLYRGFYASEVIKQGDVVLDIGCGDGFFTRKFLAPKAAQVDAVDIEPRAMEATRQNKGKNITYLLMDAVKDPFPRGHYDVIVWDGALGHFSADTTHQVLEKIAKAGDLFVGSESLGHEGSDHLQFFETLDDLARLFKPYFKHVYMKKAEYSATVERVEAYWRCSNRDIEGWRRY